MIGGDQHSGALLADAAAVCGAVATFDEIDPVTNKKKGSLGTVQQVDGAKYLVTRHDTLQDLQGQGSL